MRIAKHDFTLIVTAPSDQEPIQTSFTDNPLAEKTLTCCRLVLESWRQQLRLAEDRVFPEPSDLTSVTRPGKDIARERKRNSCWYTVEILAF